jgi:hypothetical protein
MKSYSLRIGLLILFLFIAGHVYVAIADNSEKLVVIYQGHERNVLVEWENKTVELNCFSYLFEKEGKIFQRTRLVAGNRPTIDMTTEASVGLTRMYRDVFSKRV